MGGTKRLIDYFVEVWDEIHLNGSKARHGFAQLFGVNLGENDA